MSGKDSARVVLIGGCGFVGRNLALALTKRDYMVLILDVAPLPVDFISNSNIVYQKYDILIDDHLTQLLANFKPSIVVDIAGWGMSGGDMLRQRCFWINVEGTENVLKACIASNISKLVFTSTYNVVFSGKPIVNGDETYPYANDSDHLDKYSASKTTAEKLVLQSNGAKLRNGGELCTSVIRPAAIYGEGEMRHLPRILEHIDSGIFQFRIGTALVDWVHVENLVQAYLCLVDKMLPIQSSKDKPAGQAYFISDGSPIDNFIFLKPLCNARGKSFPSLIIPYALVAFISRLFEIYFNFCESIGLTVSIPLNRAEVAKVGVTHTFSTEKAHRELGYKPAFDSTAGGNRLALYYSKWNDDNYFDFPAFYWHILIFSGMFLLYRVAFYDSSSNNAMFYGGFHAIETLAFGIFQTKFVLQIVFYAAVLTHFIEGLVALYIAKRYFKNRKYLWFVQTFLLGYPSLRLALNRSNRNVDDSVAMSDD